MRLGLTIFVAIFLGFASPAFAVMEDYPSITLQGLDKSVGRTVTFEAKVGSTIQYGTLFIKIHACRKAPPIEKPESAAFLQIWEVPPGAEKSEWVFSGWMFASSPALSAMDHPVYDVWVLDCTGREEPNEEAKSAETSEQADQTTLKPADETAPAAEDAVPTDSEAEPEPAPVAETPAVEDAAPAETTTPQDDEIPVDGEAEQQQGIPPVQEPVIDPNAPYSPPQTQTAPVDPNAAYVPPQAPQAADPSGEGIYSPSQGRIVPVQPQTPSQY